MSYKYKTIAIGYLNVDKNGGKYLAVTVKEDIVAGTKLFLRKNTFKTEDKHPDYVYQMRVDEGEVKQQSIDSKKVADDFEQSMSGEDAFDALQ